MRHRPAGKQQIELPDAAQAMVKVLYGLELGIPQDVQATALAYLVVVMESTHDDRLDQDVAAVGCIVQTEFGTVDAQLPTQFEMLQNVLLPDDGKKEGPA